MVKICLLYTSLEMYRIEEERAINHLADILTAYGIDVSAEEIRTDVYKRQEYHSLTIS